MTNFILNNAFIRLTVVIREAVFTTSKPFSSSAAHLGVMTRSLPEQERAGRFLGGRKSSEPHPTCRSITVARRAARILPPLRLPAPPLSREAGAQFPRDPVAGARREIQAGRAAVSAEGAAGEGAGMGERGGKERSGPARSTSLSPQGTCAGEPLGARSCPVPAAAALGVRCPPRVPAGALPRGLSEPDRVTHLSVVLIVSRFEKGLVGATCRQVCLALRCSVWALAELLLLPVML